MAVSFQSSHSQNVLVRGCILYKSFTSTIISKENFSRKLSTPFIIQNTSQGMMMKFSWNLIHFPLQTNSIVSPASIKHFSTILVTRIVNNLINNSYMILHPAGMKVVGGLRQNYKLDFIVSLHNHL